MKKISIIVPMYNSFHMMGRCLEVLEKQAAADIELIIVDDCSKDDSFARATEYAKSSKLNIKVIKNDRNGGPGYSRNNGLKHVTGDYITFVDSDDYFADNFTEELAPLLEQDIDCVIFDYLNVDEQGNTISGGKSIGMCEIVPGYIDSRVAFVYTYGSTCGKIYKSEIVLNNDVKFGDFFRGEDMLFTKTALAFSQKVYYLASKLYMYVQHSGSLMHNESLLDERNSQRAFELLKNSVPADIFKEELQAIELREVVYNTVLIKVSKREPHADIVRFMRENCSKNQLKNKYFSNQPKRVKLLIRFACYKNVFMISLMCKYKRKKKNSAIKLGK